MSAPDNMRLVCIKKVNVRKTSTHLQCQHARLLDTAVIIDTLYKPRLQASIMNNT